MALSSPNGRLGQSVADFAQAMASGTMSPVASRTLSIKPFITSRTACVCSTARRTIRCTVRCGVGLVTSSVTTLSGRDSVHSRGITATPMPTATKAMAVVWFAVRTEYVGAAPAEIDVMLYFDNRGGFSLSRVKAVEEDVRALVSLAKVTVT